MRDKRNKNYQYSIIKKLSPFDKNINEYKANLQLSIYDICKANPELTAIADTYNDSGTKNIVKVSDTRNTKRNEATTEKNYTLDYSTPDKILLLKVRRGNVD